MIGSMSGVMIEDMIGFKHISWNRYSAAQPRRVANAQMVLAIPCALNVKRTSFCMALWKERQR